MSSAKEAVLKRRCLFCIVRRQAEHGARKMKDAAMIDSDLTFLAAVRSGPQELSLA
jgi:hypothetical protein